MGVKSAHIKCKMEDWEEHGDWEDTGHLKKKLEVILLFKESVEEDLESHCL